LAFFAIADLLGSGAIGTLYLPMSSTLMSKRLTQVLGMLPEARRFVVEGAQLVREQCAVVVALERGGHDILDAVEHLELLEGMQAEYIDHLQRLERQVVVLVRPE